MDSKNNTTWNFKKITLVILFSLAFDSSVLATCNHKIDNKYSRCSQYKTQCYINTKDSEIAFVNKKSKQIFNSECLSHQLCYDEKVGTKISCDEKFVKEIVYKCKVNFGRLMVTKKIPKRTRTCLKSIKKTCSNYKGNCGRICVLYGSDKTAVRIVNQYIKFPSQSDYLLPGAVFYPEARYEACLSVTEGYKSAISHQDNQKKLADTSQNKIVISQDSIPTPHQ